MKAGVTVPVSDKIDFKIKPVEFSSVTQPCMTLWCHEPHNARPPCPSPTPRVHPHSFPLSQWCHPAISSSVVPCSSCPQSLPASGSFQMTQLFASGGQSIGNFSFNISPSNEHPELICFRMDWLDLLAVQGTLKSLLQHHSSKASVLQQLSGAMLGITDKMEAWPQLPLLTPQARSQDEGVRFCDSDLLFPFFDWVGWKEC